MNPTNSKSHLVLFFLFVNGLFYMCSPVALGQEPASFFWGKEEFSGIDIYDLLQDQKGDYWISSNQGIYKYDGRRFEKIPVTDTKSASFFNLCENSNGQIYFNNLSGQIFKVDEKKAGLFYQIEDSLLSPHMQLEIDDQDQLIFYTNNLLKIDTNKKAEIIYKLKTSGSNLLSTTDGKILMYDFVLDKLFSWSNDTMILQSVVDKYGIDHHSLLEVDDKLYIYDITGEFYEINNDSISLITGFGGTNQKSNYYEIGDELWTRNINFGVNVFDKNGKPKYDGKLLFEKEFISAILSDREGNVLLGTFGSGLIFIPAGNTKKFIDLILGQKIRSICKDSLDGLYVATVSGKVYHVDKIGKISPIINMDKARTLQMQWINSRDQLWLLDRGVTMVNSDRTSIYNGVGSVKDVFEINPKFFLLATSNGLMVIDENKKTTSFMKAANKSFRRKGFYRLDDFIGRIHRVVYDHKNKLIYTTTGNGVQYMNAAGNVKEIKFNGSSIIGKSIYCNGEHVYIGTQNQGLFVIKSGVIRTHWSDVITVDKIISIGENLLLLTDSGIQIKDALGNDIKSFGVSDGLYRTKATDVEVIGDLIFIAHQNGIQKIKVDHQLVSEKVPDLSISSLSVNEEITNLSKNSFGSNENKFQYSFDVSSMRLKEEIYFQYLMEGLEQDWQTTTFYQNTADYKSLPPGNYTFKAKAIFRGREGKVMTHIFQINKPFYEEWWFFMILIMLVSLVGWRVFKYQLDRKVKTANYQNELNLYKLKALRSQMNPHFIFNALNSIQEYIVMNERKMAGKYLGKFADLIRIYLHQSDVKSISVQEEIEALNIYLELEKIRFEDTLFYHFEIAKEIDTELLYIPSLLIQPYVENALKHGLLHKVADRQLSIIFKCRKEDHILECEILDNGVGRKQSALLNKQQNPRHKSFASHATKDRLALLNHGNEKEIGEQIIDLYNEHGISKGTKVILSIPTISRNND